MENKKEVNMAMQASKGRQPISIPTKLTGTFVLVISTIFSTHIEAKSDNHNETDLSYLEELGKRLFFENISDPERMSCATCHAPSTGGTYGVSGVNLHQVAVTGARPHLRPQDIELLGLQGKTTTKNAGALKPPTNQYTIFLDKNGVPFGLGRLKDRGVSPCGFFPCGGAFWNGRAPGDIVEQTNAVFMPSDASWLKLNEYSKYLGPLADQAFASPFLNPVEQNHKTKSDVCQQVEGTKWGSELYYLSWNVPLDCQSEDGTNQAFARFAVALAAWQMSADNNRFSSKRDMALASDADHKFPLDGFTQLENDGHDLFYGEAGCSACHSAGGDGTDPEERYTDDTYHSIGVPRNYEIPGSPEPDPGVDPTLIKFGLTSTVFGIRNAFRGHHKTPTLRNVDKRNGKGFIKAYTHGGWFKSLESLVHFYNTSNVNGETAKGFKITRCPDGIVTEKDALANNCWPAPEINSPFSSLGAVNPATGKTFTGDLGLTEYQESAIVAYLKTLTDTTTVEPPKPYQSSSKAKNK
ncbi:cytochrome-c peroxidase [Photobacterium galatheae]|uniref:cytochrome-c peroxidase n=1 Tax=Photobacterium galatheae TaxID=1654360 RepID=UPI00202CE12B